MRFAEIVHRRLLIFVLVIFAGSNLFGQDNVDFDSLLQRIDTIENPVYKPVISIGYGALNFIGDVKSSSRMPVIGNPAARINLSTFIDNSHYFSLNFFFLVGTLTGNQRSVTDISKNLNFSSNIYSIGASVKYEFGNFIPEEIKIRPYFALGIEQLNFNTKADLFDSNSAYYYYWPDGSIRSAAYTEQGAAYPLVRDYTYETDVRSYEKNMGISGLGDYSLRSLGIPIEIGFSLKVSTRLSFNIGTEYHFTFTDYIDNVASEGTFVEGNKAKDGFIFTHATLQFDMFSDPATRIVNLLFADVELDPLFFDDEDGDFVLDIADHCPGTPYGVLTDTLGCPLDIDEDGVPNYLDKENSTPLGVWVDDEGVTLPEADFNEILQRDEALKREDLDAYMELLKDRFTEKKVQEIPEKFATLDADEDGYISFDELLKVVDNYFDFNVDLSLEELRQVNEFFFSQ